MKKSIFGILILIISAQLSLGQERGLNPAGRTFTAEEQELINLSKEKWQWMAEPLAQLQPRIHTSLSEL